MIAIHEDTSLTGVAVDVNVEEEPRLSLGLEERNV